MRSLLKKDPVLRILPWGAALAGAAAAADRARPLAYLGGLYRPQWDDAGAALGRCGVYSRNDALSAPEKSRPLRDLRTRRSPFGGIFYFAGSQFSLCLSWYHFQLMKAVRTIPPSRRARNTQKKTFSGAKRLRRTAARPVMKNT